MKRVMLGHMPDPGQVIEPDADENHHLMRVRRARLGEEVELIDGKGGLALGRIEELRGKTARIAVLERRQSDRESTLQLVVGLAIPMQIATFDTLLPALVQLGVTKINLVPTAFSGRLKKAADRYLERLSQIAVQALKQSGRLVLPIIEVARDWPALCRTLTGLCDQNLLFHPHRPPGWPAEERLRSLGLLFGPEGGFSEEELAQGIDAGFQTVGLGPRILKMEVAVTGACFQAQYRYGDLGGQT